MKTRLSPLLVFLFVSCSTSKGLLTSLEDISTEVDRQGMTDVNNNRIVSLTGLLAPADPSEMYRYKKSRSPSTAIGMTSGNSHIVVGTVEAAAKGTDPLEPMDALRDAMLQAREDAAKLIAATLAASSAREAAGSDASLLAEVKTLDAKRDNARQAFDDSIKAAMKAVKPGMMVFRWAGESQLATGLSLGELLSASASTSHESSGFAIANGIRVCTLFVGKDILECDTNQVSHFHLFALSSKKNEDVRIVTHVMQAKQMAWFQDVTLATRIAAHLKANAQELGHLPHTLSNLDSIQIDFVLASLQNLGSMGSFKNIDRRLVPLTSSEAGAMGTATPAAEASASTAVRRDLRPDYQHQASGVARPDGYQTFYYVDAGLEELKDLYR